jgi:hypothetical protein
MRVIEEDAEHPLLNLGEERVGQARRGSFWGGPSPSPLLDSHTGYDKPHSGYDPMDGRKASRSERGENFQERGNAGDTEEHDSYTQDREYSGDE